MNKISKIILFILLLSALYYPLTASYAEIPHLINYQGRLTDTGSVPLNGSYNLTFRIYDAQAAGNLLWEETQTGVVINKGIFAVLLGSVTNLNLTFDKPYFLEIKVGNEVMTPRQAIASSGYAIAAENGTPKGGIIMWSGAIADIPSGWVLCDGANGTPDLRDRFIVGAKQDDSGVATSNVSGSLSKSGGSATKNILHSHIVPKDGYGHGGSAEFGGGSGNWVDDRLSVGGAANEHNLGTAINMPNTGSGGSSTQDILPPYYSLAFIMKL